MKRSEFRNAEMAKAIDERTPAKYTILMLNYIVMVVMWELVSLHAVHSVLELNELQNKPMRMQDVGDGEIQKKRREQQKKWRREEERTNNRKLNNNCVKLLVLW